MNFKKRNHTGKNNPNYRYGGVGIFKSEHNSWRAMKARCYQPKYHGYERYGGAGITVCERWLNKNGFLNFLDDMGPKPTPTHTVDRIDNSLGYSPENCRWATITQQSRNRKNNRILTIDGITDTVTGHCERKGIKRSTVYNRVYQCGWPIEKAIATPLASSK